MTNFGSKLLSALAAAGLSLVAAQAQAQGKVVLGSTSSTTMSALNERILPAFEKASGIEVKNVAGASAHHLARLQAQQGNQELDVVMLDDAIMAQAVSLGFCADLPKAFLDTFVPEAVIGGQAVGFGLNAIGLAYNPKVFQQKRWAAPTSWNDLARPEFKNRIAVATISNGYGLATLAMLAKANGGSEDNIEPGIAAMKKVAPNVVAFVDSTSKIPELFQTGEIALTVWNNNRVKLLADTGFPIEFVFPKEGALAGVSYLCIVKGSKNPENARKLIEVMTGAEAQKLYATAFAGGPTLKGLTVDDPSGLIVDTARLRTLVELDAKKVQANREEWARRWAREVER
ncbi:ABC transporter substrate-binding protein [Bosea sp. LjRoot90]|uniref:ABC transporter substrate-binding protein n=1 Tax=Bosea sp. LjRoot90 TaxID=3342342 RepID=UPI003ED0C533